MVVSQTVFVFEGLDSFKYHSGFLGYPHIRMCLKFFSLLAWDYGFLEEDHRDKSPVHYIMSRIHVIYHFLVKYEMTRVSSKLESLMPIASTFSMWVKFWLFKGREFITYYHWASVIYSLRANLEKHVVIFIIKGKRLIFKFINGYQVNWRHRLGDVQLIFLIIVKNCDCG